MKKIKLYQLKNIQNCKFKAFMSQFDNFKYFENKSNMLKKVYKSIIQDYDFAQLNEDELKSIILNLVDDKYFLTKQEKEVEINIILKHMLRYIDYEKKLKRKILNKKTYGKVIINDNEIDVNADIVFDNGNNIELVKYKTGVTKLSYKARTENNLPENNIELYLIKKMGEQIYFKYNKPIIASFYHLKGKKDKDDEYKTFLNDKNILIEQLNELKPLTFSDKKEQKANEKAIKEIENILYYNNELGNNIISFDYNKNMDEQIIELLNTELNYNSGKCKSNDCDFCNYNIICNYDEKNVKHDFEVVKKIEKASGEIKLTESQKQAVDIEDGIWRINATPGSGKTSNMVLRIINLFKKGYKPQDILMITFTNKGAEELKEKIKYWLDYYKMKKINTNKLNIFTFNSFGGTIISKEWEKLGFTKQPELATKIDIYDIIKELLLEYDNIEWLNYKNPLLPYKHALGAFKQLEAYFNTIKSFNYNELDVITELILKPEFSDISTTSLIDTTTKFLNDTIENLNIQEKITNDLEKERLKKLVDKGLLINELYEKFNQKLKEKSLLQYQDQVLYSIELFEKYPDLIKDYGYKHIVVDEYQDTNFTQIELIKLLIQYVKFQSLIAIGDNAQSIYSFNNTTQENILKFHEQFENVKDIFLLENFRSTPEICNISNKLDKLNTERINKEIISKKANGEMPKLVKLKTKDEEYEYIINLIEEKIKTIPKHEICVIARTKKELLELQLKLNKKNIPNIIEASELYIDNVNIQTLINLANFFKNNAYDYHLLEYLYAINDNFKNLSKDEICEQIELLKNKTIEEFGKIESEELKFEYFYTMIAPIMKKDEIVKIFMANIMNKTFYTFYEMLEYLTKIILYKDDTGIEKDDTKYSAVVLTTAHSSKGKEWTLVINTLNGYSYEEIIGDLKLLEEERRLLFVSITRAKELLYITYNTNEDSVRGKGKYNGFADELEDIERIEC